MQGLPTLLVQLKDSYDEGKDAFKVEKQCMPTLYNEDYFEIELCHLAALSIFTGGPYL